VVMGRDHGRAGIPGRPEGSLCTCDSKARSDNAQQVALSLTRGNPGRVVLD